MPAPLMQHDPSLSQRVAGLANLRGAVAVKLDLIGRELLFKATGFVLHKAQLTVVVKAYPHMLGDFAVDVYVGPDERIALPAIFTGGGTAAVPGAKCGEEMDFIV